MKQWLARIVAALRVEPGRRPAAFASLVAVSAAGLDTFDGVARARVPWAAVRRVTAEMGRQQYDMTPVLMIDHAAGRAIFLPQSEELWGAFVRAMAARLPGARPLADWAPRLAADPEAVIRVY